MFHLLNGKQCISYFLISKCKVFFSKLGFNRHKFLKMLLCFHDSHSLSFQVINISYFIENPSKSFFIYFGRTTIFLVLEAFRATGNFRSSAHPSENHMGVY